VRLYIVRHGIAEAFDAPRVSSDVERALTQKGRKRTGRAALGLRALGVKPDRIASSPLVRALETAEILGDVLMPGRDIEVCSSLAPGACAADVIEWLSGADCEEAMVVGHNPDCAAIAGNLLAARDVPEMVFGKAATCCISFDGRPEIGDGCLEWLLQPKQLRMLA
jgi:phosphohistidine phosphatase